MGQKWDKKERIKKMIQCKKYKQCIEIKKFEKIIEDKTILINEMAEQIATLNIEIHRLKNIVINDEKKNAK